MLASRVFGGNPRVTLSWTGDDDLNLVVVTTDGDSVSGMFLVDSESGGRFSMRYFLVCAGERKSGPCL